MKFAMSYSFGKDSAFALYKMIQLGHEPVCLITTINEENDRTWFHGINADLIQRCACALKLPVILSPCNRKTYGAAFEEAIIKSVEMGAECCAFGDMDIEGHLDWNKERCKTAGVECAVPLWGINRERAVLDEIELGFSAIIKCIEKKYLDKEFLGKKLDKILVEKIRNTGADVCGENGEYHTFVTDGPIFSRPVQITIGDVIDFGTHAVVDIQ